MLFLGNTQHDDRTTLTQRGCCFVPDRHMFTTAGSPGGEVYQQNSFAAEIRKANGLAIVDVRQDKIRVCFSHGGWVIGSSQRRLHTECHHRCCKNHSADQLHIFVLVEMTWSSENLTIVPSTCPNSSTKTLLGESCASQADRSQRKNLRLCWISAFRFKPAVRSFE